MQSVIADLVRSITPCDPLEATHLAQALAWIASGAPLCRTAKPAMPPQHLVAYFALFDPHQQKHYNGFRK